ncbi:acylphosphatase [uncultured Jatrophihabitans sp.]|uniref:acylphosphatase n=1 Tax=uncultured Jatrophihabitans sp. TaxID=1610747 RepID=UPI0035CC3004
MSDETTRVRLLALVQGHVQGVGFRDWTRRTATSLDLTGRASNLSDGRVEVVAEGPRTACEQLLAALRGGHTPGRVYEVSEQWSEAGDDLHGFTAG